jgi:CRISPR-associated Csx3 family protein
MEFGGGNMPVEYKVKESEKCDCTIIEAIITEGFLDYKELPEILSKAPEVDKTKGVCLSGRMPVWLYVALTEKYHSVPWIGAFDPRANKCVVSSSHKPTIKPGELIEL